MNQNIVIYRLEWSSKAILIALTLAVLILALTQIKPVQTALAAALNINGDVSMRCDGNMRILGNTIHPDLICRGSWQGTGIND